MGFDKDDSRPIIVPSKRTTKVNFSLAAGVVIFLAIGMAAVAFYARYHH
jgi:hypothetical protein